MKKLILAVMLGVLLLGFGIAHAAWEWRYPGTALVIPYMNTTSGFQTFVLINHQDTDPDWGNSVTNPNVYVRFNPKCGRGQAKDVTLTTKQSWVMTTDVQQEGWMEVYEKSDIADNSADEDFPLMATAVILDIGNGIGYSLEANEYYSSLCVDGTTSPLFYGWTCNGGASDNNTWGYDEDNPIVSTLYRPSNYGKTMVVLCDPNGRHLGAVIPNPAPAVGWDPATKYVSNRGELDIYSKSETSSHQAYTWCDTTDAGKPGIITIGIGTTAGPLGTTDASISNPSTTMNDAAYGFAQSFNLRTLMWVDANSDGLMQVGEDRLESDLLGATLTRISPVWAPNSINAQTMVYKYY